MLSEAKQTETLDFGAEKGLLIKEAPARKMVDLSLPQMHLAGWPGCKIFGEKRRAGRGASVIPASL